jgi:tetratricopeptide (TPR) repeat protein
LLVQGPVECPTTPCAAPAQSVVPEERRLWIDAAAVRAVKLEFVAALQRFIRAQAGTFGDEAQELRDSLATMQAVLKRWDEAIQQFRVEAGRLSPGAEVHLALATVLLDRHRAEPALSELARADLLDGHRADVHTLRALAYGLTGKAADAAGALRAAASIDSRNPVVFYRLAYELLRLNRADAAADAFRGFQRALPQPGTGAKGAAAASPFDRVDLLRQPAGVAPIFPVSRYVEGFAALQAGDYATALARFEDGLAHETMLAGDAGARQRVANAGAALRGGELQAALAQLEAAVAETPDHAEGRRVLALAYWIDGQNGRSIEQLRAAIALAPVDERARILLVDVLLEEGRTSEAERELRLTLDAGIRSGQVHYRLAQLYRTRALLPQAVHEMQVSETYGPVIGRDHFLRLLGGILVDQARFDAAVAAYTRRIDINPNHGEAHRQLGEIYFLLGRHAEALAEFSAASWLDPNDARAHAAAGQVQVRTLNYAAAIPPFERALSLDPHLREARYALGISLTRAGRTDAGRRELETFRRQQADADAAGQREFQLEALRREASRQLNAGDGNRAIALFEEVLAAAPQEARSHRDLGLALVRLRRAGEAIAHLEAAQRLDQSLEGFSYLAQAYNADGNRQDAARYLALYGDLVEQAKRQRIRELAGEP